MITCLNTRLLKTVAQSINSYICHCVHYSLPPDWIHGADYFSFNASSELHAASTGGTSLSLISLVMCPVSWLVIEDQACSWKTTHTLYPWQWLVHWLFEWIAQWTIKITLGPTMVIWSLAWNYRVLFWCFREIFSLRRYAALLNYMTSDKHLISRVKVPTVSSRDSLSSIRDRFNIYESPSRKKQCHV